MPLTFTEIANALDDLTEMEEGVRAQRACIALAKKKWEGLVATEIKKDGGEDAILIPGYEADEETPGVAVSNTNTLAKVKIDAKAISNRGVKIGFLVFYTPRKVSNTMANKWAKEIENDFNHGLLVISREDIIQSLLQPDNEYICERILGLNVGKNQSLEQILNLSRVAARKIINEWFSRMRAEKTQLISLEAIRLDENGKQTDHFLETIDLKEDLLIAERIVLLGGLALARQRLCQCLDQPSWRKHSISYQY